MPKGRIEEYGGASWMPDSQQVVFTGREPGRKDRCYTQLIGAPEPKPITAEGVRCAMVSPDGKSMIGVDTNDKNRTPAIYPVAGDEQPRPIPGLVDGESILRWSDDGRSLYVRSGEESPIRMTRLEIATGRREVAREVMPR